MNINQPLDVNWDTPFNEMEIKDQDTAIDNYCQNFEEIIYTAIKSITLTIPPGKIIVSGSATNQTNIKPIILNNITK